VAERAAAEQALDAAIERFGSLARDLEQVVRDEVRAAFVEEFAALGQTGRRAAEALEAVRRAASLRLALWAVGVVASCCVIPAAILWTLVPTRADLSRLRAERDALAANVAQLTERGGRIDLRRCGAAGRLCARVDRSAPAYGARGDYFVLSGY